MTALELKLNDITSQIFAAPAELRVLMTAKLGTDRVLADIESGALKGIFGQCENWVSPQLDPAAAANQFTYHAARSGFQELGQLAMFQAAANALDRHPRMSEATAIFTPLLLERDRLRVAIAAEVIAIRDAREAAENAVRLAQERAAAAAAADPSVAAARAALASLENPAPAPAVKLVRGKIPLATES